MIQAMILYYYEKINYYNIYNMLDYNIVCEHMVSINRDYKGVPASLYQE